MIYKFDFDLNWTIVNDLSRIDRFGGTWTTIEKRERQTLKHLKFIATVRSVGASTRIEGARMTDDEIEMLLKNLKVTKLEERDQQEVMGYFDVMDQISDSFRDIDITASSVKHLHNQLMKYSAKDSWHRGDFKKQSNELEATHTDGTKYPIFKTTGPGLATQEAMQNIIDWYNTDKETHSIVRSATLIYEFLSVHPFQDGNGRLSRLLSTLLLLKNNYSWIQYVSFEHEIENRKLEYYKVLMDCQRQRPGENIYPWISFFLSCLSNIQDQLMKKLEAQNSGIKISPRERMIYQFIENHPGVKSGEIAEKLHIPLPSVKKILADMLTAKSLLKHSTGAGTNYTIEAAPLIKKDLLMKLENRAWKKKFQMTNRDDTIEIKKIILTPTFDWVRPDDWAARLIKQGLYLRIICINTKGASFQQDFPISSYNSPYYYQPVFTLNQPIVIPGTVIDRDFHNYEYPVEVSIELLSRTEEVDFEVMLIYDETGR